MIPYIDDCLIAPSPPGSASNENDPKIARVRIDCLMTRLGLVRKVGKGCWEGARKLDHLGMHIDSVAMKVYV